MGHAVTLGGDRLGSGNNQQIYMDGYHSSNHDLGYIWRSSMTCGTLVPFMKIPCTPGDNIDINLKAMIRTLPTVGPLYGSFKYQMDVFFCPTRLYIGALHNNRTGVGQKMEKVLIPKFKPTILKAKLPTDPSDDEINHTQVAPDSLIAYMGINGYGWNMGNSTTREFNALPFLMYYDIFKNYYSNKQERDAYFISPFKGQTTGTVVDTITLGFCTKQGKPYASGTITKVLTTSIGTYKEFYIRGWKTATAPYAIDQAIAMGTAFNFQIVNEKDDSITDFTLKAGEKKDLYAGEGQGNQNMQVWLQQSEILGGDAVYGNATELILTITNYLEQENLDLKIMLPQTEVVSTAADLGEGIGVFPLENIDEARERILSNSRIGEAVEISAATTQKVLSFPPYQDLAKTINGNKTAASYGQCGLVLRTYLSDMYNNWVRTEWIEQANAASAIQVDSGSFTMDALIIAKRVWNYLNRIGVSGGTYQDWQEATWGRDAQRFAESPIYMGGASGSIDFDEVVSNSAADGEPLGTLAGRGNMGNYKGGKINVKVQEQGYIIGIVSIVPRVDYYQGNDWDMTEIKTMYDWHKPEFDRIGFQDLLTERMAAWSTIIETDGKETKVSAGKQPAWTQYMSAVNRVYGDFQREGNAGFMVITRKYEPYINGEVEDGTLRPYIKNLTTYVFPHHYNYLFAIGDVQLQPFWVQIGCNIFARRIMSAAAMPEL